MLDFNAITQARMQEIPYRWAFLENLFPEKYCLELANSYPQEGLERFQIGERSIFPRRVIIDETKDVIESPYKLNNCWQELVDDLRTSVYRAALGELTGLNLMDDLMYIYFFRFDPEDSINPHPDASSISMVQLFYFNQEWDTNWGGCLRILKDDRADSVFQEIPPLLNTSVILVRSENSWHTVTPVASDAPQSRRVLKVAFLNQEEFFKQKASASFVTG
ncbi:2OG-Fe(II) oxygenase [Scytonema sp. NUACC26]|uniref:2OG-Fe(II) oxygenase n=1 Tax=Scytonema sp. NUACC26 TaxID=3140176 RepID=UPI0034DC168D